MDKQTDGQIDKNANGQIDRVYLVGSGRSKLKVTNLTLDKKENFPSRIPSSINMTKSVGD